MGTWRWGGDQEGVCGWGMLGSQVQCPLRGSSRWGLGILGPKSSVGGLVQCHPMQWTLANKSFRPGGYCHLPRAIQVEA
jgi:hypothetical protein